MPVVIKKDAVKRPDMVWKLRTASGEKLYKLPEQPKQPQQEKNTLTETMTIVADIAKQNYAAVKAIVQTCTAQMEMMLKNQDQSKAHEEWDFEVIRDSTGKIERIKATRK